MPYCCVPRCKSELGKTDGVSFHEVPANLTLREKWIQAIRRKDWVPSDTSNYSRVCSRHFKDEDFIQGGKRRRLKPGVVPTVFDEFPSYLQKKNSSRKTSSIEKRAKANEKSCLFEISNTADYTCTSTDSNAMEVDPLGNGDASTQCDFYKEKNNIEVQKWKRKLRTTLAKMRKLQEEVDDLKIKLNDGKHIAKEMKSFVKVYDAANEKDPAALFIMSQISNFEKKRPTWSEHCIRQCIMWKNASSKGYEYARRNHILKLPSNSTLKRYMGDASTETGVTNLVINRLNCESEKLTHPQEKLCSLIVDEMKIKEKLTYDKAVDEFFGEVSVDIVENGKSTEKSKLNATLAKYLLCFLLSGLSTSYKIPVAYYFTQRLTGIQLFTLMKHVIGEIEKCGFQIVRLVADNHKVNTTAYKLLGNGTVKPVVEHPNDASRPLFISFDPCHVIKNARSQFLAHDLGGEECTITSEHVKTLYKMQKNSLVKPVRFLSRKHVQPNNMEKMNVHRAVQLFSPPVTAALHFLQNQAGKCCDVSFSTSAPTIEFMETMYKWFQIHDTSNCTQHIHQRQPNVRQFDDPTDERLEWLETDFLLYLEAIKKASTTKRNFLSEETHQAIKITSQSTALCVRYLLEHNRFYFVLTRRFNSDPIESLFGILRQSAGSNDMLDARAVIFSLGKMLKTGIIGSNAEGSNVASQPMEMSLVEISGNHQGTRHQKEINLPEETLKILHAFHELPVLPTTADTAAIGMVAGYLVRTVEERVSCEACLDLISQPESTLPIMGLIRNLDRGGLRYPTISFLTVVYIMGQFVEAALPHIPSNVKVREALTSVMKPKMKECHVLLCKGKENEDHSEILCSIMCEKFLRPLLTNYANSVTDKYDWLKTITAKPLSRKWLRL